jgi:thiamine pyrophosphokinase
MKAYKLPNIDEEVETVILANGEFPSHEIPLSIFKKSKYLVCCDGAINHLSDTDKQPNAIVGDCDSLSEENLLKYADIIHRISEQETNDLTKAVHFCLAQNRRKITILGAAGKREDHTIANVSLLCEYMMDADVEMITDHGVFVGINKTSVFRSYPKQQVSLFCIDRSPVTLHGLAYPVTGHVFTNWWQATLNESIGDVFTIETAGRTIVYRTF